MASSIDFFTGGSRAGNAALCSGFTTVTTWRHSMRKVVLTLMFVGVLAQVLAPASAQQPDTLYKRLGGYDAIAAVVDNFVPRLVKDPVLAKYFVHSQDTLTHIRQLAVDMICAATGGPCVYIGRDMKTAHQGMGITEAEFNLAAGHLAATLDKFKVPEKEKNELLGAVASFKNDIVEQKPMAK